MFVSSRKPLLLLERMHARTLECGVGPLPVRNVEETVHRPDQLALCVAQRVDVDRYDQRRAVSVLDDTFHIAHRPAGRQHLGHERARDGCPILFEEAGAFPKFIVCLSRVRSRTPHSYRMASVLKYRSLRAADKRRDRQQLENTVRRLQHRAQQRWNPPRGFTVFAGITHPHASARALLSSPRCNDEVELLLVNGTVQARLNRAAIPVTTRFSRPGWGARSRPNDQ